MRILVWGRDGGNRPNWHIVVCTWKNEQGEFEGSMPVGDGFIDITGITAWQALPSRPGHKL